MHQLVCQSVTHDQKEHINLMTIDGCGGGLINEISFVTFT